MGELLKPPVSLIELSRGFRCSYECSSRSAVNFKCACGCLSSGLAMKANRRRGRGNRIVWLGNVKMKMSFMYVLSGSIGLDTSVIMLKMASTIGSVMVCQGEEVNGSIRYRRNKFDLEFGQRSTGQPSTSSNITIPDVKVYFLEERSEEVLSGRLLRLCRSNRIRSALELYRSMELSGVRPGVHACNSLLSCLLRNKLLDDAFRIFEFMKNNDIVTGHSYSLLLKSVANIQGFDSALEMFAKLECHSRCKDFDVIVYNTMMSICRRVNNWSETEKLWRKMKENGLVGTEITYSLLVSIFARCDCSELALDAYNEMVQNEVEPQKDLMQAMIGVCAKEGKWYLALNIFRNMLNHGLKPNLVACNALINSIGKAGDVNLAFEVYDTIKSLGHSPDAFTLNSLLSALYRANQHAGALQLFERIEEQSDLLNEHTYNTALRSCQKLGLWDRALQLLWKMEVSGLLESVVSFNLVIGACEIARKPEVALQVYEHLVHQQFRPDTFTHLSLIRSCIWGSLWSEVEGILDQVEPDANIYNAAIHGMCLRGKVQSAKKLYERMQKIGLKPDGKTRAFMLQNLRKKS